MLERNGPGSLGAVVSVVPAGLNAAIGNLANIDIHAARSDWWRAIRRAGLEDPVIGGIDVSFNEMAGSAEPGYFQVHLAFAVLSRDGSEPALKSLKKQLGSVFDLEPSAPIPLQVKVLRDPMRQLSYLQKSMFARRVSIIDGRGRRNTLPRPLKPPQLAEIAIWLDRYTITERLLLHGVRRIGNHLVVTDDTLKMTKRQKG